MWTALTTFIVARLAASQLSLGAWFAANAAGLALKVTPFAFAALALLVGWLHGDVVSRVALVLLAVNEFIVAWALAKLPMFAAPPAK